MTDMDMDMSALLATSHPGVDAPTQTDALSSPSGIAQNHPTIQPGDLVILYVSHTATPLPLTVTPGQEFVNIFGAFPHDDMVGLPFGSRVFSRNKKGFIHLLRPTPSLWTLALPHRTQILYYPDISFVSSHLGLTPGARVIEAGTGSGSMTHALVRAVATEAQRSQRWLGVPGMGTTQGRGAGRNSRPPRAGTSKTESSDASPTEAGDVEGTLEGEEDDTAPAASDRPLTVEEAGGELLPDQGRVWSFEFHSERAQAAKIEFEAHGLVPNVVALNHRNVCRSGFGLPANMYADAIFLDLPAPWEAIPFAKAALNPDIATRICTFSPCMEQVLRTTQALSEAGFSEVETFESLTREHQPFTAALGPLKNVSTVASRLNEIERIKEVKRLEQIKRSKNRKEKAAAKADTGESTEIPNVSHDVSKEAVPEQDRVEVGEKRPMRESGHAGENEEPLQTTKKIKLATEETGAQSLSPEDTEQPDRTSITAATAPPAPEPGTGRTGDEVSGEARNGKEYTIASGPKVSNGTTTLNAANVLSKPAPEMRGHTSYLTFATLRPQHIVVASSKLKEATQETQNNKSQDAGDTHEEAPAGTTPQPEGTAGTADEGKVDGIQA